MDSSIIALQNRANLNARNTVRYLRIPTVEEARHFFGPVAAAERVWRNAVCFDALLTSPRSRLGIGEHDRAEAYIFGNGVFPEEDRAAHRRHFPVSVKVMTIDELFIAPHEVVDLSAHADEFPWNTDGAEIYLHLTINRLALHAQSKLVVKGNVFILNCLKAIGNIIGDNQAVIELGSSSLVQHSIASRTMPMKQFNNNGHDGAAGEPLKQSSTPLGIRVSEASDACNGQKGGDGSRGADGSAGANGAMLFLSDLRFGELEGFQKQGIKIRAGAAPGFPGAIGDVGGAGGKGGEGASGLITPFGLIKGFAGGNGGHGGSGGNGGRGGNGGLTCDVFVSVPHQKSTVFEIETFASPGGKGGDGGKGGKGGAAGMHGMFYDDGGLTHSLAGEDGVNGLNGQDGKTRNAPNVHIYERP
ncbi:hypothetical protein A4H97_17175 [Niastella yeongjuensis]|uniref:Uncharacterized protein n=1 Tax=Niastella yeongjuensis TaxID=354355 RepID=A0A1V9E1J1_9BACT|nr:hypothetical protein [Niastella yeongjuensis]OQP39949.1 hypothetical protein A4H97_17175 [Niastella yeongjuensis]SEO11319.1 hypothetical protein SAMN05660816_02179 [Niastella yeongjuensis]